MRMSRSAGETYGRGHDRTFSALAFFLTREACSTGYRRRHDAGRGSKAGRDRPNDTQAPGPNSTSTGVGVLTSVLNLSLPFASWMRNTAMVSVFWFAA